MSRCPVLALLGAGEHDYPALARPLMHALDLSHHFDFATAPHVAALSTSRPATVLAATDEAISPEAASALVAYVRGGGGLVLLHSTLAAWAANDDVAAVAGWRPGRPGPQAEIVVRNAGRHPLTERIAGEIRVEDELFLTEGPPADADVLLRASWQYSEQVVAYARAYGDGRVVHIGLGHGAGTYRNLEFQKLVHRALLWTSGVTPPPPTAVGLAGYGAIARLHAASIAATAGLELRAVCDLSADRRAVAERELGVVTYPTVADLVRDPDVGLVVVGTPPSHHADPVIAALDAGKHAVCEKPFAITLDDVDRMIDAATSSRRVLTVYQSRRWDPDYIVLRETVKSGGIGELFYMESFIGGHSHPCDYWHSHEPISGGTIYDWGSHYFDWILGLFDGPVTGVSAVAHKRVWHDVTNADQVRVDLTFAGGAQATFMQSDIAAALKPKWYVLGTRGAIVGDWRPDSDPPAELPATITVSRPSQGGGGVDVARLALPPRDDDGFYRNLADHLAWDEPLAVPPQEARRNVAVMEAATRSIAAGGARLEVTI